MIVNKEFLKIAAPVFMAAKANPLVPIMEYVLVSPAGDNTVYVTACTAQMSCRVVAPVIKPPAGPGCLHAPTLFQALKSLQTGEVEVTKSKKTPGMGVVIADGCTIEFPILHAKDFPNVSIPQPSGEVFSRDVINDVYALASKFCDHDAPSPAHRAAIIGPNGVFAIMYAGGAWDLSIKSEVPAYWPVANKEKLVAVIDTEPSWHVSQRHGETIFIADSGAFFKTNGDSAGQDDVYAAAKGIFEKNLALCTDDVPNFTIQASTILSALSRMEMAGSTDVSISGGESIRLYSSGVVGFGMSPGESMVASVSQLLPVSSEPFETKVSSKIMMRSLSGMIGEELKFYLVPFGNKEFPPALYIKSGQKSILLASIK